ncbi:HD domain-containing protein [Eudoraea chungangensis]|uniref:HD domain-containing protein n=1 Tax=Eudoraea chungangensis TaxID=1481905 RepID=UPI0023ECB9A2|nr:HD domain-containing protein [Eudoraea chungangensis]
MKHKELITQTETFVKNSLNNTESGHNWFHIDRVRANALQIAKHENADTFVVELASLLHDIGDSKFHNGNESIGPSRTREFLMTLNLHREISEHIVNIVKHISFKNTLDTTSSTFNSLELDIVQDADRLDAIGAIGIARAFSFGGFKNREIYDPSIKPNLEMTKEEYKNSTAPTINHFYEKLLLVKEGMNTSFGKRIAQERDLFMREFLEQFYKEWKGIK